MMRSSTKCRGLIYDSFGNPWEKLRLRSLDFDPKTLSDDSVKVRFLASPINPSDLNQIEGTYPIKPSELPAFGGNEGVGLIEATGAAVQSLNVGDLVIPGRSSLGCWRDFACLKAEDLIKIPEKYKTLPLEVLATLNVNPPTAYRLLKDFVSLKPGDSVIQNGANSAVGRLVIQMASILGVKTVNVIRDRTNFEEVAEELKKLAPDEEQVIVIKSEDLKNLDLKNENVKLGLNCVGGGVVADMSRVISKNGTIVTHGAMSRRPLNIPAAALIFQNLTLKGFWLTSWYQNQSIQMKINNRNIEREKMFDDILMWYLEGKLKPVKSFWIDVKEDEGGCEEFIKTFVKESIEGLGGNRGKGILRFI